MIDNSSGCEEIASAVRSGKITATSVIAGTLRRCHETNAQTNAFSLILEKRATLRAKWLDEQIASGINPGPLAGVPYAVKNLYDLAGEVTVAGARVTLGNPPAGEDALLVKRLESSGAVCVGTLHMGEFAYDFTGENSHYGACRNPWDLSRMTGGSSSGSGAALAAGAIPLALGTDTNGSIRVPSSFCGVMGLKPTYGRLPRSGTYPFCDSLDHVGPMTRNIRDLTLVFDILSGFDPHDHACIKRDDPPALPRLTEDIASMRVGVVNGYFRRTSCTEVQKSVAWISDCFSSKQCSVKDVDLPLVEEARAAAFLITNAESSTLHKETILRSAEHYDLDTRDRFRAGLLMPAHHYIKAQAVRRKFAKVMHDIFSHFDVIIAPATPCSAPAIGEKVLKIGNKLMPLRPNIGLFTQPFSSIGLPVCCVPSTHVGGFPFGVQIIAAPWREDVCLTAAYALEAEGKIKATISPLFKQG